METVQLQSSHRQCLPEIYRIIVNLSYSVTTVLFSNIILLLFTQCHVIFYSVWQETRYCKTKCQDGFSVWETCNILTLKVQQMGLNIYQYLKSVNGTMSHRCMHCQAFQDKYSCSDWSQLQVIKCSRLVQKPRTIQITSESQVTTVPAANRIYSIFTSFHIATMYRLGKLITPCLIHQYSLIAGRLTVNTWN